MTSFEKIVIIPYPKVQLIFKEEIFQLSFILICNNCVLSTSYMMCFLVGTGNLKFFSKTVYLRLVNTVFSYIASVRQISS